MTGSEAPLASGSLVETPFAHLMLYLYRQAGAGTLHVRSGSGAEVLVRVQGGRPTAARSTEARSTEPGADLMQLLLPACGFKSGEFAFYAGDLLDAPAGEPSSSPLSQALASAPLIRGELDPYALLYASLREHARDDMVDGVLARYPRATLALPADRDVSRLQLDEGDQAIVDALRHKPATVDAIVMSSPLPGLHTRRLLYALLVTHMLAPQEARSSEIYKSQVEPEPPPATPPRPHASHPSHPSHPSHEGAPRDDRTSGAAGEAKPAAPRITVQRPVAGTVNEVASASMPAWQQLMSMRPQPNEGPRKTGDGPPARSLQPGRASLAMAASDPSTRRRRVEQFMQGSRFAEALGLLDELVGAEPNDAKLHGLRARALFEVHRGDPSGLPKTVLEAIKRAQELDADEANAYFVRGLIYKQAGELQKALACWKRALATDAKHIDAQREIRLAMMRK